MKRKKLWLMIPSQGNKAGLERGLGESRGRRFGRPSVELRQGHGPPETWPPAGPRKRRGGGQGAGGLDLRLEDWPEPWGGRGSVLGGSLSSVQPARHPWKKPFSVELNGPAQINSGVLGVPVCDSDPHKATGRRAATAGPWRAPSSCRPVCCHPVTPAPRPCPGARYPFLLTAPGLSMPQKHAPRQDHGTSGGLLCAPHFWGPGTAAM